MDIPKFEPEWMGIPVSSGKRKTLQALRDLCTLAGIEPDTTLPNRWEFKLPDDTQHKRYDRVVIFYPRTEKWLEEGSGNRRQQGLDKLLDFVATERRREEAKAQPKARRRWPLEVEELGRELVRLEGIARSCNSGTDKKVHWEGKARQVANELARKIRAHHHFHSGDAHQLYLQCCDDMRHKWVWYRGNVELRSSLPPSNHGGPKSAWSTESFEQAEARLKRDPLSHLNLSIRTQQLLEANQINPKTKLKMKMNPHYLQACIEDDIVTVGCVFLDDFNTDVKDIDKDERRYTFKSRDLDLKPGDLVLGNTAKGPRVVMVAEIHEEPQIEEDDTIDYQWIFQKVDVAKASELKDEDKAFIEQLRKEKRKAHRQQIKERFVSGELLGFKPDSKGSEESDDDFDDDEVVDLD